MHFTTTYPCTRHAPHRPRACCAAGIRACAYVPRALSTADRHTHSTLGPTPRSPHLAPTRVVTTFLAFPRGRRFERRRSHIARHPFVTPTSICVLGADRLYDGPRISDTLHSRRRLLFGSATPASSYPFRFGGIYRRTRSTVLRRLQSRMAYRSFASGAISRCRTRRDFFFYEQLLLPARRRRFIDLDGGLFFNGSTDLRSDVFGTSPMRSDPNLLPVFIFCGIVEAIKPFRQSTHSNFGGHFSEIPISRWLMKQSITKTNMTT